MVDTLCLTLNSNLRFERGGIQGVKVHSAHASARAAARRRIATLASMDIMFMSKRVTPCSMTRTTSMTDSTSDFHCGSTVRGRVRLRAAACCQAPPDTRARSDVFEHVTNQRLHCIDRTTRSFSNRTRRSFSTAESAAPTAPPLSGGMGDSEDMMERGLAIMHGRVGD